MTFQRTCFWRTRIPRAAFIRLGCLVLLGLTSLLQAADAQEFYKGKTLTIVVGFSPGGGFDAVARLLSRHIGQFIPGQPSVVVKNMPGAGTMTAVRHLATGAPKDGTTITAFTFGLIGQSRLVPEKVPLDFRQFAWIGSVSEDLSLCYTWHALGIKTLTELRQRKNLHFGVSGIGTNDDLYSRILKSIFEIDLHQVSGYPGSTDVRLAVERGELDGHCGAWSSLPEAWIRNRLINPVFRTTESIPPDIPKDIPYMMDLIGNDRQRAIVRALVLDRQLGRPYIASPEVPADRVRILRDAFNATVQDPQFLADAETMRLPVSPRTAEQAIDTVDLIYATPPDIVAEARTIMTQ
jgi:tripartite-type tricarboxylate transporter receptor subunit TctC